MNKEGTDTKSNKMEIDYTKKQFTDEEKIYIRKEVEIIKFKYPKYIPIIVISKSKELSLKKSKFLVGQDLTVGQFQCVVRKRLEDKINASESMFMLTSSKGNRKNDSVLLSIGMGMAEVYKTYMDTDTQMLFIEICKENTFGNKN